MRLFIPLGGFGRRCSVPACLMRTLRSGRERGRGPVSNWQCRPQQRKVSTRAEDGSGSSRSGSDSTGSKTVRNRTGETLSPYGPSSAELASTRPAVVNPSAATTTETTAAIAAATKATPTLLEAIRSSPLGRLGRLYEGAQKRRPYVTQAASALVIYLLGDLSAQLFFPTMEKGKAVNVESVGSGNASAGTYDPLRTMRHLIVGLGMSIPGYKWFMFLHHHFNYTSKFLSILTKVVVQQVCFTPVFSIYFFGLHSLLAGATVAETGERLRRAVPESIANSVKLWPAVTAFSFMYIPPHFRSVFTGLVAVGWQTYLSWLNQRTAREVEVVDGASEAHGWSSERTTAKAAALS